MSVGMDIHKDRQLWNAPIHRAAHTGRLQDRGS